ncbi:hypothetical protein Q7P37_009239 [Cladosporium fusiforme]
MQTFVEAQRKRASPLELLRLVICQWSFVVTSRAHLSVGVLLFGLMKLPKDFSKPVSLAPTLLTGVGKDAQTRKYDARCLRAVQSAQEEVRRLETTVPRHAALKAAYGRLRAQYDHLRGLFTRLKAAYTATASALPEEVRSGDGIPEILENTEVWKHSPDIAGTSDDGDPTAQDENLTPLDESRFDVTALSPSKCPLSSLSDTNMYSSSCILHLSSAKSDGTEPSVCQWVPRAGKGFEAHIMCSHFLFVLWANYLSREHKKPLRVRSMANQAAFEASQAIHWSSRHGDLIKRAFWICVLHERSINLEFCVAETGIEKLAELVPLPHFPGILDKERASGNPGTEGIGELKRPTESDYAYHLSAVIDLGRSIRRANDIIHDFEPVIHSLTPGVEESPAFAHAFPGQRLSDPTDQGQLPHRLVHELAHELECWRLTLPSRLQWSDDRKFDFTEIDPTSDLSQTNFFNLASN